MRQGESVSCHYYYVDESGDGVLFNSKGKVIVGENGCSRFFMLGLLLVADPDLLAKELTDLRLHLLADPYFTKIPSMQPERRKTAIMFHAKDDIPEVRREVFSLLRQHDLAFFASVKDKLKVVEYVRQQNVINLGSRYSQNDLYDFLARGLFKNRLHQQERYEVTFATRGGSDRTRALAQALEGAKQDFSKSFDQEINSCVQVMSSNPERTPSLQAADYFLWALQRLYERGEDRYWDYLSPKVSFVHDMDDTSHKPYGRFYGRKKPLTLAVIKDRLEI